MNADRSEVRARPRALEAAGLAAACLALWDAALAALLRDVPLASLPWLAAAALALTLVLAAPLGLALAAASALWARGPIPWLRRTRARRAAVAALALAGAAGIQWANATLYVRLYLTLHALLSLVALSFCAAGLAIALPPSRRGIELRGRAIAAAAAGLLAWTGLFGGSLWAIISRHELRLHAVDRTTLLAQELLVLDAASGFLSSPAERGAPRAAAALEPAPPPPPGGGARGKSALLLTIDSLRSDRLDQLPRLSALADRSLRFTRAYSPSCWTVHAMTAVMTSRLPSDLRFANVSVEEGFELVRRRPGDPLFRNPVAWRKVTPVPIDEEAPTLAELLGGAGYQTATVPAYVFYLRGAGLSRGFGRVDEASYRELSIDGAGVAPVPMVDRALGLLAEVDEPYFLWLHFMEPHAPYRARDEAAQGAGPEARYDSELRFVDREIGRLLDALSERGELEDTVIAVFADHGEEFGDHGGAFHASTVYEEIVRVPLLIRLPGAAGRVVKTPVSLIDLAPTLLDLLGVRATAPMRGRSLAPAARGLLPPERPLIVECDRFGRSKRAVIDGRMKLIVDRRVGTVELYDLSADPGERDNLADERPETVSRLLGVLSAASSTDRGG